MHHRHFVLLFIPLLCFALIVGGAHGSPFPRCKKASSRCVGFVIGFIGRLVPPSFLQKTCRKSLDSA